MRYVGCGSKSEHVWHLRHCSSMAARTPPSGKYPIYHTPDQLKARQALGGARSAQVSRIRSRAEEGWDGNAKAGSHSKRGGGYRHRGSTSVEYSPTVESFHQIPRNKYRGRTTVIRRPPGRAHARQGKVHHLLTPFCKSHEFPDVNEASGSDLDEF